MPARAEESLHLATWAPAGFERIEEERCTWAALFNLREVALADLERARQAKTIGKALEAKLKIAGKGSSVAAAKANAEALRELLNVSQLQIAVTGEGEGDVLEIIVDKADGEKCERCWHWETDVGRNAEHPTLCGRCVKAIKAFSESVD